MHCSTKVDKMLLNTWSDSKQKFNEGESSYTLGINQFADKKPDEFRTGLLIPSQESEQ